MGFRELKFILNVTPLEIEVTLETNDLYRLTKIKQNKTDRQKEIFNLYLSLNIKKNTQTLIAKIFLFNISKENKRAYKAGLRKGWTGFG